MIGEAVPYGDPKVFAQKMKNLLGSNAFPLPIIGPHQSSTSALPVNAWQIIMTLSLVSLSLPQVLYATGTCLSVVPHSRVNSGRVKTSWSMSWVRTGMRKRREDNKNNF